MRYLAPAFCACSVLIGALSASVDVVRAQDGDVRPGIRPDAWPPVPPPRSDGQAAPEQQPTPPEQQPTPAPQASEPPKAQKPTARRHQRHPVPPREVRVEPAPPVRPRIDRDDRDF